MSPFILSILIWVAMFFGQFVHLYFKWREYKLNGIADPEDDFIYLLKKESTSIGLRLFLMLGVAAWIGFSEFHYYIENAFYMFAYPFYAFVGYTLDSFIRNMFTQIEGKFNKVSSDALNNSKK